MVALGLDTGTANDEEIIRRGIWIYALYRTMCALNAGEVADAEQAYEMMAQFARSRVIGHTGASKVFEMSFVRRMPQTNVNTEDGEGSDSLSGIIEDSGEDVIRI